MCRGLERSKLGLLETTPPRSTFQTSELFGGEKAYSCSNCFIAYYPISIARPKHTLVMAGGLEGETFIGPKAEVSDSRLHWLLAQSFF